MNSKLKKRAEDYAARKGWRIVGTRLVLSHDRDNYKGDFIVTFKTRTGTKTVTMGNIYD